MINPSLRGRLRAASWCALWLFAAVVPQCAAQTASPPASTVPTPTSAVPYYSPSLISPVLRQQFIALGTRLQTPGNEQIRMTGSLTDLNGTVPVQVVIQNGGNLNLTWVGTSSVPLTFNGTTAAGVTPVVSQEGLLESFVDDLPDTLMGSVAQGMGLRLLGQRFQDSSGGACDFYDVPSLGQANKRTTQIAKRYCFDSRTFLRSA